MNLTALQQSCTCDACVQACKQVPGAFAHGEAEHAAEHLGLTFEAFCEQYLRVNFYVNTRTWEQTYFLQPRIVTDPSRFHTTSFGQGFMTGRCVFLDANDRCAIHAVKPRDCREAVPHLGTGSGKGTLRTWRKAGNPLEDTLPDEPGMDELLKMLAPAARDRE